MPKASNSPAARRSFLARAATLAKLGAAFAALRAAPATAQPREPIRQPERPGKTAFMQRAFAMREAAARAGDQSFGAVVVKDGRIVGEAPSRVVTGTDPTAHAEMEALRDAARRLGTRDLSGCDIYASTRPCPMCEAASYWAGIARIHHGADAADAGPPRLSRC
jgi:tRNA(Arg) A34 adenosine deaminase TadA